MVVVSIQKLRRQLIKTFGQKGVWERRGWRYSHENFEPLEHNLEKSDHGLPTKGPKKCKTPNWVGGVFSFILILMQMKTYSNSSIWIFNPSLRKQSLFGIVFVMHMWMFFFFFFWELCICEFSLSLSWQQQVVLIHLSSIFSFLIYKLE